MSRGTRRGREPAAPVYRRRGPIIAAALSVLPLIGLSMFALDRLLHPNAFRVEHVRLDGEFRHLDVAELEQAVAPLAGGNFFAMDLGRIERAAEALPWVQRASVRRYWPWSVEITVVEHQAGARWNDDGWLNTAGDAVALPGFEDDGRLPRLHGPSGSGPKVWAHYRAFAERIRVHDLALRELELSPRGSWRLGVEAPVRVVDGGDQDHRVARFDVVLGRLEVDRRLARFVQVWPDTLSADAASIRRIDFRYPNGFALEQRDRDQVQEETGA